VHRRVVCRAFQPQELREPPLADRTGEIMDECYWACRLSIAPTRRRSQASPGSLHRADPFVNAPGLIIPRRARLLRLSLRPLSRQTRRNGLGV
jgi:hypothetical protein